MLAGGGKPASSLPALAWRDLLPVTRAPWLPLGKAVGRGRSALSEAPGLSLVIPPCCSSVLWLPGVLRRLRRCGRRDGLSQPPAWCQKASRAVHTSPGLARSSPAGECAQERKERESRCEGEGERLVRGGAGIPTQHSDEPGAGTVAG